MKKNIQQSAILRKAVKNFNNVQREQFYDRLFQYKILLERTIDRVASYPPNRMPSVTRKSIIAKHSKLLKAAEVILKDLDSRLSEIPIV